MVGIRISKFASINNDTILEENVTIFGKSVIGKNTMIGLNCIIGYPSSKTFKEKKNMKGLIDLGHGSKIGDNCFIRPNTHIYESTDIDDNTQTGHYTFIREETKIGKNCVIGTNSVIDGYTIIEDNTLIESNVYLPTKNKIGKNNFFGPNVCVTNDKIPLPFCIFNKSLRSKHNESLIGIDTEDFVCIGANTTILPGIKIGYAAVIGAGSVVTKDVKPESVVFGVPAKPISKNVYDLLGKQIEILLSLKIRTKGDIEKLPLSEDLKKKLISNLS